MTASEPPNDPGSSRRSREVRGTADRYETLLEVLEAQAARAEAEDGASSASGVSGAAHRLKVVALLGLIVVTVWLWVLPPPWLIPPAPAGPSAAEQEAGLRFGVYLQAQRIRVYELEHGVLPRTLDAAGPTIPGVTYEVVGDGVYELTGETDRVRVTYRSDEPLREWVGSGAYVLDERLIP